MKGLVIYKENKIKNLKRINYYKDLSINGILIDEFIFDDTGDLDIYFDQSKYLKTHGIKLFLTIDAIKILDKLIGQAYLWANPKIRNSFYQFINFLIKYGVCGFYFKSLDKLIDGKDYFPYIKELVKNTISKKGLISIIESDKDLDLLNFLSNPTYNNFSYVGIKNNYKDFIEAKSKIASLQNKSKEININQILKTDDIIFSFLNNENYPYHIRTLASGISFFQRGAIIIENLEEIGFSKSFNNLNDYKLSETSSQIKNFYQKILKYKATIPALYAGTYRQIFKSDPDIFAYIRIYNNQKVLVFSNFSQKEVLVDIRFHFLDLYDFKYLIGNYGKRRIVKNLLLRPYEFVSFVK